jgi:hypothetical protein
MVALPLLKGWRRPLGVTSREPTRVIPRGHTNNFCEERDNEGS